MVKARRAAQAYKAYQDLSRPGSPGLGARIRALPRMLSGAMRGDYRELGKGKLALMGMAILYIVSPVDVVPEALFLALGVVDDFGVFLWLASSLLGESGRYVDWERKRMAISPEVDLNRRHA
ncbi:YkvA family protein [Herbidospora cretacea]|uniref:YkvA family protein n=1 Tax=Herbidospora cretacea TaxID=28444 RepID=UPI0007747D32|nr:YkvA family protein [Herbidospora cretacea]